MRIHSCPSCRLTVSWSHAWYIEISAKKQKKIQGQLRVSRAQVMQSYRIDVGADHRVMSWMARHCSKKLSRFQRTDTWTNSLQPDERHGPQHSYWTVWRRLPIPKTAMLTMQNWNFEGFVGHAQNCDAFLLLTPLEATRTSSVGDTFQKRIFEERVSTFLCGRSVPSKQFSTWQRG